MFIFVKFINEFCAEVKIPIALDEKIQKPIKAPIVKLPITTKILPTPIIIIDERSMKKLLNETCLLSYEEIIESILIFFSKKFSMKCPV